MNRYVPKYNVYVTPDGVSTLDPGEGKNKLVVVSGVPLSPENATRLGIPELESDRRAGKKPVSINSAADAPTPEPRTRGQIFTKEEWKDHEKEMKAAAKAEVSTSKESEKSSEVAVDDKSNVEYTA